MIQGFIGPVFRYSDGTRGACHRERKVSPRAARPEIRDLVGAGRFRLRSSVPNDREPPLEPQCSSNL